MVDDVGKIASFMHDYGPFVVILAIFLLIFLITIAYILQSHKKAIEAERETNKQIVTSLMNNYFSKTPKILQEDKQKYNEKNIVETYIRLNKVLKDVCEEVSKKTNSDRTAIYVFHNGTHASHGFPFSKLTCICEWISKSSSANMKMSEHSAIPLNVFDSIVQGLFQNSEYRITTTKEDTDPGDILFLRGSKIKDCFFIPIYATDNNMMGFVFNGYNEINPDINIELEKKRLIEIANTASPVIEFSRIQEIQSQGKE